MLVTSFISPSTRVQTRPPPTILKQYSKYWEDKDNTKETMR